MKVCSGNTEYLSMKFWILGRNIMGSLIMMVGFFIFLCATIFQVEEIVVFVDKMHEVELLLHDFYFFNDVFGDN